MSPPVKKKNRPGGRPLFSRISHTIGSVAVFGNIETVVPFVHSGQIWCSSQTSKDPFDRCHVHRCERCHGTSSLRRTERHVVPRTLGKYNRTPHNGLIELAVVPLRGALLSGCALSSFPLPGTCIRLESPILKRLRIESVYPPWLSSIVPDALSRFTSMQKFATHPRDQ